MKNPIKDSILKAYNKAVYLIMAKERSVFLKPGMPLLTYLSEVVRAYQVDVEAFKPIYFQQIFKYLLDALIIELQKSWPIHPAEIRRVLHEVDFTKYDKRESIFSERNVMLLTDYLFEKISAIQPNFVSKGIDEGIGKMIGMDRDLGQVYDNTWVAILIFFLIVFVVYLLATGETFLGV